MEVLSSRLIVPTQDLHASRQFYETKLGLAIYREYGAGVEILGVVYFLGGGFLELTTKASIPHGSNVKLWLQVRDVYDEQDKLVTLGVRILSPAQEMPWGLHELWIAAPDGLEICILHVPAMHPLRRRVD